MSITHRLIYTRDIVEFYAENGSKHQTREADTGSMLLFLYSKQPTLYRPMLNSLHYAPAERIWQERIFVR